MTSEITREAVTIWSEGSRLAGEIIRPAGGGGGAPGILLCHGWGGLKEHLAELYAVEFARAGFVCLVFDYRGWGESDGRLISAESTPMLIEPGEREVRGRVIREVVDPVDQVADIRACLAYLSTEEGVDPNRIGLWGSSYGGGHVVFIAGTDPRPRAVVAQIGGYGHPTSDGFRDFAFKRMADKARGRIDPPVPQGIDGSPGLRGAPDVARQYGHSPVKAAESIRVPTLFLDAEFEEYNTPDLQGGAVYEVVRRNAVAERHTFPCAHYKVYDEHLEAARQLALDWFKKHL
jgi:dienelactone hydrolase